MWLKQQLKQQSRGVSRLVPPQHELRLSMLQLPAQSLMIWWFLSRTLMQTPSHVFKQVSLSQFTCVFFFLCSWPLYPTVSHVLLITIAYGICHDMMAPDTAVSGGECAWEVGWYTRITQANSTHVPASSLQVALMVRLIPQDTLQ